MKAEYVIDSSAWFEYFGGTKKGLEIQEIIDTRDIACCIITFAELASKCEEGSWDFKGYRKFIKSRCKVLPMTEDICIKAASLKHKHRPRCPKFSLADGFHLACAEEAGGIFVTCDNDFKDVERAKIF